jgi:hypothetical protein
VGWSTSGNATSEDQQFTSVVGGRFLGGLNVRTRHSILRFLRLGRGMVGRGLTGSNGVGALDIFLEFPSLFTILRRDSAVLRDRFDKLTEILDQHENTTGFIRLGIEKRPTVRGNCNMVLYFALNCNNFPELAGHELVEAEIAKP